jgi:hypothetical protein
LLRHRRRDGGSRPPEHARRPSVPDRVHGHGHGRALGRSLAADHVRLVAPLLAETSHAVWLLPTPAFRRAVFERRGPEWGFLAKTRDPQRALANLLERDRLFTDPLREEARRSGLRAIEVDGAPTEEALAQRVTEAFGL